MFKFHVPNFTQTEKCIKHWCNLIDVAMEGVAVTVLKFQETHHRQ